MKIKSFVVAGMIAAVCSPVMAGPEEFEVKVDKEGNIIILDENNEKYAKMLDKYNRALKLSEEIKTERQRCLSAGNFWYDSYCISKNPCTGNRKTDKKHCKVFDLQVGTPARAANIVKTYVKKRLGWEGCANMRVPKSKIVGQDYITCVNPEDGNVMVFEFDDISETNNVLAERDYATGMCVSVGGTLSGTKYANKVVCRGKGVDKKTCEDTLNGYLNPKLGGCDIAI